MNRYRKSKSGVCSLDISGGSSWLKWELHFLESPSVYGSSVERSCPGLGGRGDTAPVFSTADKGLYEVTLSQGRMPRAPHAAACLPIPSLHTPFFMLGSRDPRRTGGCLAQARGGLAAQKGLPLSGSLSRMGVDARRPSSCAACPCRLSPTTTEARTPSGYLLGL